ncbi:outer membrane protein assembly factor BamA [Rhodobacteraceae bacterium D3-12]|nr:outer membrane protein assembly factor BamA [Rhodobacteraceae bacterium D3-12]
MVLSLLPDAAEAQSYRFNSVNIEGNKRIESGTILSYAGIGRGQTVSAGELNDAYQRILGSGLFESVEIEPRGGTLAIKVKEFPTINRISFEGNKRLKDEGLAGFIKSRSRLVFSPTKAERDAEIIAEAYNQNGRLGAAVSPKIIRRSDNRVDLVFEIFEGGNVEVQRIGFVGNQVYSDRRLRRVLETKQAGLLRALIKKDTFLEDRLQFDQQVLRDFYLSRGYVDFRTVSINSELARERNGYFVTFNVEEGQQFRFGEITTTSEMPAAIAEEFQAILKVRPGIVYSPSLVENSIARMERLAIRKGIDFLRVEPRITRNDRDLTLDIEFVLSKGPRIFVERIDVEGNATTLDRVVRRQFKVVEGDPFNPREIRESAERVRALGYFGKADVNAREGSSADKVIIDVDVEETTTGSLTFGGSYSTDNGFGLVVSFQENNFLGRGQTLNFSASGATDTKVYGMRFVEPAFLGRDVEFHFDVGYQETDSSDTLYDTQIARLSFGLDFPIGERSRFGVRYGLNQSGISHDYLTDTTPADGVRDCMADGSTDSCLGDIIAGEAAQGDLLRSSLGYTYTFDSRLTGLNPNAGVLFEFSQDFAGLGGDVESLKTTARLVSQTKILNEEVTLRATLVGGILKTFGGSSRVTDRFLYGDDIIRGFDADGIGPREIVAGEGVNDALGGNMFVTAKFEAEFPLGLPEEYGITGGVFYDVGSVWGLDTVNANVVGRDMSLRHVAGVSIFWTTPIGPLRLNFSRALKKETYDIEQNFEFTIRTEF